MKNNFNAFMELIPLGNMELLQRVLHRNDFQKTKKMTRIFFFFYWKNFKYTQVHVIYN